MHEAAKDCEKEALTVHTTSGELTAEPDLNQTSVETFQRAFRSIGNNIARVVHGKEGAISLALTTFFAGGHLLIEDVPGVGKTSLAKALATSIDADFQRVQFSPDLLPSDIVGTSIWEQQTGGFSFQPGPLLTQFFLADEINRASPKTQSALLEAMAERQITVDGQTYELAKPFMVIATQNPSDQHGTFPLPESQLDRFLMCISLGYPDAQAEKQLLKNQGSDRFIGDLQPIISTAEATSLIDLTTKVHVAESMMDYLIELADRSRRDTRLTVGISPRATLSLMRAMQTWALASGRVYVTPDDAAALLSPVLAHRVSLTPAARQSGLTRTQALRSLLDGIDIPR